VHTATFLQARQNSHSTVHSGANIAQSEPN